MGKWTTADIPDQTGRTAVITGANTGLGYETAAALAAKGAHVVLAVRNLEKGKAAADLITRATPGASVAIQELDLTSLESIRAAADELRSDHAAIDLLINNAGVMFTPKSTTKDGFELQFGTNHLGHFALTNLLLDRVLAVPGSRIVTVSSVGHRFARAIRFDDLQWERSYSRVGAYGQAKLANLMFTYELQRRLQGTNTIAVAAHPGGSRTELTRNLPPLVGRCDEVGGAALPERRDGCASDATRGDRSWRARRAVLRPRRIRRTAGLPEGRRVQRGLPRHRGAAPAVGGVGGAHFGGDCRRLNVAGWQAMSLIVPPYPPARYIEDQPEVSAWLRRAPENGGATRLRLVRPREVPLPGQPASHRRRLRPVPGRDRPQGRRTRARTSTGRCPRRSSCCREPSSCMTAPIGSTEHPNDFLYVPPGGIHGFRNEADEPTSILMLFAPGAPREHYFEGMAQLGDMTDEERREWFIANDNFFID